MRKIGIIGGGNMGEAILKGLRKTMKVRVCEMSLKRRMVLKKKYKINCVDSKNLVAKCKIIVLAIKPQNMDQVLCDIAPFVGKDKLIVSIAAGITCSFIEKRLCKNVRVIRCMPNMPALIGQGITAMAKGKNAKESDLLLARKVLLSVGDVIVVQEKMIDGVTAVSGSGPAYVFYFIEQMIQAAKSLGLKESIAKTLVKKTFLGSSKLMDQIGEEPKALRAKVTSKGGTTEAAMKIFKTKKADKIIEQAVKAANKRAKQLSKG